jgi:putative Ca2+/H+ antiporter (TMEM165/GDT1 family)
MLQDILIPMVVVGLAEFGDKTQIALLLLASKTEKRLHIVLGAMMAFLMVDGIAILAGDWIADAAPGGLIKALSGTIFIIFGFLMLRNKKGEIETEYHLKNPFYSGFILIFVSEWGDKTQIVSGLLAAKYNGLMVLLGIIIALGSLSLMAVYLGRLISNNMNSVTITKIAGILFMLMGTSFFLF